MPIKQNIIKIKLSKFCSFLENNLQIKEINLKLEPNSIFVRLIFLAPNVDANKHT